MASLTPGILSKLLQNIPNKNVKVIGEHRSPLLQVIGIVPSLGGGDDHPWQSKGFYLRVSDSLHSAYVSVSETDVDLILSDKIQLGQFIHVTRLDSGSPVPVLCGLKPVPKRRECVGDPKDLISSDSLVIGGAKKGGRREKGKPKPNPKPEQKVNEKLNLRRISMGHGKNEGLEPRRLSLDSARKAWDQSPRAKNSARPTSSRSPSVILSRKATPEKALAVKRPSSSISPLMQFISSRKASSEKNMIVKHPGPSILPLKNVPSSKRASSERDLTLKHPSSSSTPNKNVPASKKIPSEKESSTLKHPIPSGSPLRNKNVIDSPKQASKPITIELKSSSDGIIPSRYTRVPLSFKTWSDAKILWDSLPASVHDLGKEVLSHRNVGFIAAVHALQETSATENVLRCMRMFAELCEASQTDSAVPLVECFLKLHHSMQRAAAVIYTLLNARCPEANSSTYSQCSLSEICKTFTNQNAAVWVQASLETTLSKFNLFVKEDTGNNINAEKCHYVVLENTPKKVEAENHSPDKKQTPRGVVISDSSVRRSPYYSRQHIQNTRKPDVERDVLSKGHGLKDAASLVEKMLLASRAWFLNYLEASLEEGFWLSKGEGNYEIAHLLGQLKSVNQWLDDSVGDGSGPNERIEGLKKKLYGFLLDHVDSAVTQTGT